jgi:hypothetical protein
LTGCAEDVVHLLQLEFRLGVKCDLRFVALEWIDLEVEAGEPRGPDFGVAEFVVVDFGDDVR